MLVLLRHGSAANASAATDTGASAAAFIPDAAGDDTWQRDTGPTLRNVEQRSVMHSALISVVLVV